MFKRISRSRVSVVGTLLSCGVLLAGCAAESGGPVGPQTMAAGGKGCTDLRHQLDRLDARGVPAKIEAQNNGSKLSSSQKADVDLYNRLLQQYLGARCHL